MEPHERICYTFYYLFRKLLIAVGHDAFQISGFRPNLYAFFLYGLNALSFVSFIYTVLVYDVATGLHAVGYGAINVQVNLKALSNQLNSSP